MGSDVMSSNRPSDGSAWVKFKTGFDGRTVVDDLYQRAPCRVQFPTAGPDDVMQYFVKSHDEGVQLYEDGMARVTPGLDAGQSVR